MPPRDSAPPPRRLRRALLRFAIYGSLLLGGEVAFYTVVKLGRRLPLLERWLFGFRWEVDPRLHLGAVWDAPLGALYGQASLWMILVYGCVALFGLEPACRRMRGWPIVARGVVYAAIILAMECAAGWTLRAATGYDIWLYEDGALTLFRYASLAIAPVWFLLGLAFERFLVPVADQLSRVRLALGARPLADPPLGCRSVHPRRLGRGDDARRLHRRAGPRARRPAAGTDRCPSTIGARRSP